MATNLTSSQQLLGTILTNRINAELAKPAADRDFTSIESSMDVLVAGGKITAEQYTELTNLINSGTTTTTTTA